jgi:hypothetical protein
MKNLFSTLQVASSVLWLQIYLWIPVSEKHPTPYPEVSGARSCWPGRAMHAVNAMIFLESGPLCVPCFDAATLRH